MKTLERRVLASGEELGLAARAGLELRIELVSEPGGPCGRLVRVDAAGRRRGPAFRLGAAELLAVSTLGLAAFTSVVRGAQAAQTSAPEPLGE